MHVNSFSIPWNCQNLSSSQLGVQMLFHWEKHTYTHSHQWKWSVSTNLWWTEKKKHFFGIGNKMDSEPIFERNILQMFTINSNFSTFQKKIMNKELCKRYILLFRPNSVWLCSDGVIPSSSSSFRFNSHIFISYIHTRTNKTAAIGTLNNESQPVFRGFRSLSLSLRRRLKYIYIVWL